jgi:hypothetical protein
MSHQNPKVNPVVYIKTRARSLPIFKCYISKEWKECGMASITVARQHKTGNITFGVYLVDLFARGTKDTFCNFNKPISILDEILEARPSEEIDYHLAHSIIFGANNYAKNIGFKIHKDFENLTKFILEVYDEKQSLIDVEFGKNGKPFIIDTLGSF